MPELQCLIVEDDPAQAEIFSTALKQAGYTVTWLDHGGKAIDYLKQNRPDIVILDLHLPEVAGTSILHAIREAPHLSETRVILATADPRMADTVATESDLVLIKPVSYIQLRELARRLRPDAANGEAA